MSSSLKKAKAKLRRRPVQLVVMQLVVPETGELVGALVPAHPIDRRILKERRFGIGKQLRADLKQSRNPKFWRLAHVLGAFLVDHVEGFEGLGPHDALKRLQELSGVGVEEEEFSIDLGSLGVHRGTRMVAESLNFDDVDEGRFQVLWAGADGHGGWIGWLRREKFGGLDAMSREEVELLIQGEHP